MNQVTRTRFVIVFLTIIAPLFIATRVSAELMLGAEELVKAGGVDILVPGYSVPSFVFWDGDGLKDLVVGEGGGGVAEGKVRVYLNVGSWTVPAFASYFYAQSDGSDLVDPGSG